MSFVWLNARGQKHQQFTRLESLKLHNPKLASLVETYPDLFWDGKYCYHLTAGGYVIRWFDFLKKTFNYEKHKRASDPAQMKLCVRVS